jgi:AcrR family transcriptional regulator
VRSDIRRRGDAAKTREKLIGAAADVFNRDGYWGTDTNRIARAAGYSPGTFYKHFVDKRVVFLAVYERCVANEWQAIQLDSSRPVTAERSLRRIAKTVVEHYRRWAGVRSSLRALAATDPVVRAHRQANIARQLESVRSLLARSGLKKAKADCLFMLLLFERIGDAIADGDGEELGVSDEQLLRRLVTSMHSMGIKD